MNLSSDIFRSALHASNTAILITDAEGDQPAIYANPAFAALTGYSEEEILGRNCRILQGPDSDGLAVRQIGDAVRNGRELRTTLLNYRKDGSTFWNELFIAPIFEQGRIVRFVGVQTDVTARLAAERQLAHLALHDPLTGLVNRRGLREQLQALHDDQQRTNATSALAVLDLDDFKVVNDAEGHQAGDIVLNQVATTVSRILRANDIAARLGGDEFVLVLRDCEVAEAHATVIRVIHAIAAIEASMPVTASAGFTTFGPDQHDADAVLAAADVALYEAKSSGKGTAVRYSKNSSSSLAWVDRVRRALSDERLTLHAQPIVDLEDLETVNEELLLRPLDENDGVLSPAPFLAAAERFSLTTQLDRWVVCRAGEFADRGRSVAVNLSGRSIGDPEVLDEIRRLATRVDPDRLCFEITETAAIGNLGDAVRFANELRDLGCDIALDDFGTGYGGFTYLRHLPVTRLKIDMGFVSALPGSEIDKRIISSIVSVAQHLELETVAEGVEDLRIVPMLRELGVSYGQGYAFGRPALSYARDGEDQDTVGC